MEKQNGKKWWAPYLWLLPSIILISVFVVFPILIVFRLSFSDISKAGVVGGFVGLKNYIDAVHLPAFGTVMKNTFWWVISVVGLSTLLGFIIAMVMNGSLNSVLLNLGIIKEAVNWRSSYQIEFIWECAVGIFVTIPFVTFCVLSGLQSIDESLYESARVDGAGFWSRLFNITLPLVRPSLSVSTVLNIIYVFNSFPIIYTMTKGAPANKTDTMITYLYMLNFYDRKKGPANALSVIGFLILCLCSGIYMITVMRKEEES